VRQRADPFFLSALYVAGVVLQLSKVVVGIAMNVEMIEIVLNKGRLFC